MMFFNPWSLLSPLQQSSCDGGVQNYLNEDQIPFRFLLTLMVQFISLIIDRAIYLRRNMKGKIIFYVISVVAVHIWLFHFLLLFHEKPSHPITWPPMLFYFIKCIYFLLSAYQIRCGYPKRVSDNFANNGFSVVHWRVSEVYETCLNSHQSFYNVYSFLIAVIKWFRSYRRHECCWTGFVLKRH